MIEILSSVTYFLTSHSIGCTLLIISLMKYLNWLNMKNWAGLAVLTLYLTGNLSIDTSFHMKFKHWHLLWRGIWAGYTVLRSGGCGLVFSWSSLFWQWQHPLDTVGPGTLSLWWLCSPPATKVIHQIIQYTLYMGYHVHVNVKLSLNTNADHFIRQLFGFV